MIKIKNFRIVNGCQTSSVISSVGHNLEECRLMLRLIETDDEKFATQIAVAKNRQAPIKGRDLFAHDEKQLVLAKAMEHVKPPFYYERRTGDWDLHFKNPQMKRKFHERVIRNNSAAEAYLAIMLQEPFKAKHKARSIFQLKQDGGLYEEVFHDHLNPEELILADEIFSYVADEFKNLKKRHRELSNKSEQEPLSETEKEEYQELSYIVHARPYVDALMWYIALKAADGDKNLTMKKLMSRDRPLKTDKKQRLRKLYDEAKKSIIQHLAITERVLKIRNIRFNPRNFFARTSPYSEIQRTADRLVDIKRLREDLGIS